MSPRPPFRIAKIPIRVEWPFFLIAALLGGNLIMAWPGNRLVFLVIWVAIVFVSILVHELGHVIAYRLFGQHPSITITAFWGLTHGQRPLPKVRSIVVSLSGVIAAMLVLGLPALALRNRVFQATGSLEWYLVIYQIGYINLWWSVANLLPLLPLDGGDVAKTIWGLRVARILSLVSGTVATIWLFLLGNSFAAIFVAMLALMNLAEAMQEGMIGGGRLMIRNDDRSGLPERSLPDRKSSRREAKGKRKHSRKKPDLHVVPDVIDRPIPRAVDPGRLEAAAWDALRMDDAHEAESLLLEATGRGGVSPHLSASIAAAQERRDEAVRLFVQAFARATTPPNLVVARVIEQAHIAVPLAKAMLASPDVDVDAIAQLQNHLHFTGAYRSAAQVGELLAADERRNPAQSCYEVACSWAKAGDPQAGLAWLIKAVHAGFKAPRLIEGEDDLATVRALPDYAQVRAALRVD